MGKKKNGLIISGVIFILILLIFLIVSVTKQPTSQSALPDDLKLYKEQFPLQYDWELKSGQQTIRLNDGLNLDTVYRVEYYSKGCSNKFVQKGSYGKTENVGSSETINFNGKNYDLSYSSCSSLFYGDEQFSENQYQHYEDRTILISSSLNTEDLNINILADDINSINRILRIYEMVDCDRSSQCNIVRVNNQEVQPICDINYHQCSIEELPISNIGTEPDKVTPIEIEKLNIWEILGYGAIIGIVISLGFYLLYTNVFYKKRR